MEHAGRKYLLQETKKIIVAPKEHMQTHLNMVTILVLKRPHLPADELPRLINVYLATSNTNAQQTTKKRFPSPAVPMLRPLEFTT